MASGQAEASPRLSGSMGQRIESQQMANFCTSICNFDPHGPTQHKFLITIAKYIKTSSKFGGKRTLLLV